MLACSEGCAKSLAVVQYAEKLEDVRKKKLEEMIAAVRAGKPQGSAPKAAVPEKVAHHVRLAHMMLYPSSSCLLLILTSSGLFSLSYRLAVILCHWYGAWSS